MNAVRVPCVEGLFAQDGAARVFGSRCASCGTPYFPRAAVCHNPGCGDSRMEECSFGGRGVLWSYSVVNFQPPAPYRSDPPFSPYVIGVVDLDCGLRMIGQMVDERDALRIGAPVELVVDVLYHEGEVARTSWKFRCAQDRVGG